MLHVSVFLAAVLLVTNAFPRQSQDAQQTNPSTPGATVPAQHDPQAAPAPQTDSSANRRIHDSIADLLSSDPVLSSADVEVAVDDRNITLSGSVENQAQHQRVMELTAQYGRWRKIIDKIQMK
jgi:osmotically-inducible protein OsmY